MEDNMIENNHEKDNLRANECEKDNMIWNDYEKDGLSTKGNSNVDQERKMILASLTKEEVHKLRQLHR